MYIEKIEEYTIDFEIHQKIQHLLQSSFGQFPTNRIFLKQVPTFRLLVWEDAILVAQTGVIFRTISLDGIPYRIFGIMDLCVHENYQNQKIGSTILKKIEILGKENHLDFIVLFSGEQDFYLQNGFKQVQNRCRWVFIKDYRTMGVMNRLIPETLLIKPLSDVIWNETAVLDLLGFVF